MYVCMYVCMHVCMCLNCFTGRSAREHDLLQNFQDAPHGSVMCVKIFRTLRTGARFFKKFSRPSARERDFSQNISGHSSRERDFSQNFHEAPHGNAIFLKIFMKLHTGTRFSTKFSRRSAWERDFSQSFQNALHGSAILVKRERS